MLGAAAVALVAPLAAGTALAAAQPGASDPRIAEIERQLRDVQDQLAQMRRRSVTQPPVTAAQLADTRAPAGPHGEPKKRLDNEPRLSLANGRFTVTSRDGDFSLSLRSLVQFDAGYFAQGRGPAGVDLNSGTNFRRAQIGLVGTAWKDWSYNFTYDFGGNGIEKNGYIYTASLQYDFEPFAIRVGAFSPPAGIEDSTGSGDLLFLERAGAADIARGIAGAPGREGFNIYAQGRRYLVSLAFTGPKATEASSFDEQEALVSRASFLAVDSDSFKWLLDADLTHVFKFSDKAAGAAPPNTVSLGGGPEVAVDSFKTVNTGNIDADSLTQWGVETAAQSGRFYGQGGYFHYSVQRRTALPDPDFSGWYATVAVSLTGEERAYDSGAASFRGLKPAHPLGKDGFGAWEVAARYSNVDLAFDPFAGSAAGGVAGGEQNIWTLGLNWYPTAGLRFMLDYVNIQVIHVEAPAGDISASAVALRSQISL
jgi:phosphate-selective porin OprO/OprP